MTDYKKIKEVLGGHFCIAGNISPALLAVGTPQQCYDYCKEECDYMGDTPFMMVPGCSAPPDAKRANIEACIQATLDSK
jgi:uroporphyrinogen decarboxylase